jgi:hypothetical protein
MAAKSIYIYIYINIYIFCSILTKLPMHLSAVMNSNNLFSIESIKYMAQIFYRIHKYDMNQTQNY